MSPEDAKQWSEILNIPVILIACIIVFCICLCNLDKLYMLLGSIQKLFTGFSKSARKGVVSNSIKGRMLKASKILKTLDDEVMLKDVKIEWVKEEKAESFINKNQVILRLEHKSNPNKNFVTAVSAFVEVGLLTKAKRYVDKDIIKSTGLAVARNIILNGDSNALDYFDDNILNPKLLANKDLEQIYIELKVIEGNGMFYQILLNEYSKSARQIYPDEKGDECFTYESSELLRFLHTIASKNTISVEDFCFSRNYFKIQILFTANTTTYKRSGSKVYIKQIIKAINDGIETIYIFGLGQKKQIAQEIAAEVNLQEFRITNIKKHEYRHKNFYNTKSVDGVCYEISAYKE